MLDFKEAYKKLKKKHFKYTCLTSEEVNFVEERDLIYFIRDGLAYYNFEKYKNPNNIKKQVELNLIDWLKIKKVSGEVCDIDKRNLLAWAMGSDAPLLCDFLLKNIYQNNEEYVLSYIREYAVNSWTSNHVVRNFFFEKVVSRKKVDFLLETIISLNVFNKALKHKREEMFDFLKEKDEIIKGNIEEIVNKLLNIEYKKWLKSDVEINFNGWFLTIDCLETVGQIIQIDLIKESLQELIKKHDSFKNNPTYRVIQSCEEKNDEIEKTILRFKLLNDNIENFSKNTKLRKV